MTLSVPAQASGQAPQSELSEAELMARMEDFFPIPAQGTVHPPSILLTELNSHFDKIFGG